MIAIFTSIFGFLNGTGLLSTIVSSLLKTVLGGIVNAIQKKVTDEQMKTLGWNQAQAEVQKQTVAAQKRADDAKIEVATDSRNLRDAIDRL